MPLFYPPPLSRLQGSHAEPPNYALIHRKLNESSENWYAVKVYADKPIVMKYLSSKHIETFIPMMNGKPFLGSLLFLHCSETDILKTKADWFHQIVVYRDAEKQKPQAIPEKEMENFKMVLSIKNQEFYPLEITDKSFLAGQKVKVLDGPLKGAVGVVKRIKGDRRLVVSISGVAAIATLFVKPELLEAVEG